jgi:hypothetical protein
MRKAGGTTILFIAVSLMLLFFIPVTGLTFLFNNDPVYGQQPAQDKSQSRKQRLGTDTILSLPYNVKLVYGKGQNVSLNQEEFILLGNNPRIPGQHNVAISNPDYGLSKSFPTLTAGENFVINSTTNAYIKYASAAVLLVPIASSPFPPTNKSILAIDPEVDLVFSTPIKLGTYAGNSGSFVIPQTASPGYYLLYVYFQYPTYNMTAVYNIALNVTKNSTLTDNNNQDLLSTTSKTTTTTSSHHFLHQHHHLFLHLLRDQTMSQHQALKSSRP